MTNEQAPAATTTRGVDREERARLEELLADMSVAEKAGQLTQYFYFSLPTGVAAEPALGLDLSTQPGRV